MTEKIEVLVVEPDGSARFETVAPGWEGIKPLVGGWIEAVSGVLGEWIAYGDEDGRLKHLQPNGLAAGIIMAMRGNPVPPVGRIVFVGQKWVGGEDGYADGPLPEELRALLYPLGE